MIANLFTLIYLVFKYCVFMKLPLVYLLSIEIQNFLHIALKFLLSKFGVIVNDFIRVNFLEMEMRSQK